MRSIYERALGGLVLVARSIDALRERSQMAADKMGLRT